MSKNIFTPDEKSFEVRETRQSVAWLTEDKILCSYNKKGAEKPTQEEEQAGLEWFVNLFDQYGKLKLVLDTDVSFPSSKQERDEAGKLLSKYTSAMALVATKPMSRITAKMFFGINPPDYPVKIFKDHSEALEWIRSLEAK